MTRPKTNICLNMIVKNEEKVLPRLFRSVKDFIDYYVIVDTGSTDGTIELIKREMAEYGIDGEVHERPWVNFGVNRQQALELAVAADKAEWLLFIDADEELEVSDPKFYEKLEPGVSYDIEKHHADVRYAVPHLINIRSCKYRWAGPVHNYLVTEEGPKQRPVRKDLWIIYHLGEGAKSHGVSSEEKFLRDAKMLEDHLEENPGDPRSQFYLGKSYRDAGQLEKAREAYRARVENKQGWAEERFFSQLELGKIAVRLEEPEAIVVQELMSAYQLRPQRAEPLYELTRYYRVKKNYPMALLFGRAAAYTPRPNDSLFVAQGVYDWRALDELSVVAYRLGQHAVCIEACETILRRVEEGISVPEGDLKRIGENLEGAQRDRKPDRSVAVRE